MEPEAQSPNLQGSLNGNQFKEEKVPASPKSKNKKTLAIALMGFSLALIAGGILYFMGQRNKNIAEASPTPAYYLGTTTEAPLASASASPLASPKAFDKTKVSIQILNGTGIPKEASYLDGILKSLGYTNVTAANSDKQDYTDCEVTYSSDIVAGAEAEITSELKKIYKSVKTGRSTTQKYSVVIITGLRTGATAKASSTPTPKASLTPTPRASLTPTPTALVSPSPAI